MEDGSSHPDHQSSLLKQQATGVRFLATRKYTVTNKIVSALIWLYAIACALVLFLVPPTREDRFGILRHPHGGVPGLILALPWSLAMRLLHYHGTAYTTTLVVFAMAMNIYLFISLYRWLTSRRSNP
ncbi:MAG: hypothetical protein PW789_04515 [Edaphobacter sp.]|uniref:hypothetical protein n=1 Tax=Edaphobacter sp. TaxID=1934404 RepID=UPI0023A5E614|nr:hypothetical protein [Edaphobacter sp.]MDE1175851.1 hypothetical protein [Edaphobacter sp.]